MGIFLRCVCTAQLRGLTSSVTVLASWLSMSHLASVLGDVLAVSTMLFLLLPHQATNRSRE